MRSAHQLQLSGGWSPAPCTEDSWPICTRWPSQGHSTASRRRLRDSEARLLHLQIPHSLGFSIPCWPGYLCDFSSARSPCLNHTTLPKALLLKVLVPSHKLLILPLTYVYSSPTHTCLFIVYSCFQQIAFIQCLTPSQGREGQVSHELTGRKARFSRGGAEEGCGEALMMVAADTEAAFSGHLYRSAFSYLLTISSPRPPL